MELKTLVERFIEFNEWSWEFAFETGNNFQSLAGSGFRNTVESPLRLFDMHTEFSNSSTSKHTISIDRFWYHWRSETLI